MTSAVLSSSSSSILPTLATLSLDILSVASLLAGLVVILGRIPLEYELEQKASVRERQRVCMRKICVFVHVTVYVPVADESVKFRSRWGLRG